MYIVIILIYIYLCRYILDICLGLRMFSMQVRPYACLVHDGLCLVCWSCFFHGAEWVCWYGMNAMKDMVAIGMQCLKTINMFFLHSFRVGYIHIYIYIYIYTYIYIHIYIHIYIYLKILDFLLRNLPSWDPNLRGIDSWPSHDEAQYQGFNSIQKPLQKASSMPPLARGGQWLQFRNDRAWSWTSLVFAWQDCMPQQET
jgi:hypothetical protein